MRFEEVATRAAASAITAQTDLKDSQASLIEVEQRAKLAPEILAKFRKQSTASAKTALNAFRQLMEMSTRAQGLDAQYKSLESKMDGAVKIRDDMTRSANKRGW